MVKVDLSGAKIWVELDKDARTVTVIDTTLSVLVGLIVIGFCCITSNILRISPIFKKWLFGRS